LRNGFFIVIEGPDGSGKSTQARLLTEKLEIEGRSCIFTEEPGGTDEGKHIRDLILNPRFTISPRTELFLFLADRSNHVENVIRPALERGSIVICSRYIYSTLVYQGMTRQIAPFDFLLDLNLFAVDRIIPDIVFYLDIPPHEGLHKAVRTSQHENNFAGGDRIEREGVDFQKRVREGYEALAERFSEIFITINGSDPRAKITAAMYTEVTARMKGAL